MVGLALSNALTVTNSLSYLVSMASEVETNMVGVERIKEYQEIVEEAPLLMPEQVQYFIKIVPKINFSLSIYFVKGSTSRMA